MEDERLAEIMATARATRKRPSRAVWIVAGVVGVVCAIGFVLLLLADGSSTVPKPIDREHGYGFAAGLAIGLVAGILVGYSIARNSSRNKP